MGEFPTKRSLFGVECMDRETAHSVDPVPYSNLLRLSQRDTGSAPRTANSARWVSTPRGWRYVPEHGQATSQKNQNREMVNSPEELDKAELLEDY